MMKKILLTLPLIALASCATTPEAVNGWIDVPLSEHTWQTANRDYLQGEYQIPVAAQSALEYKIGMQEGDAIVYDLKTAMQDASLLDIEFHGHTEREGDAPGTVMFYVIHSDGKEKGSLVAPFTGIHGWYLNNQSDEDIIVTVNIAGFYEVLE